MTRDTKRVSSRNALAINKYTQLKFATIFFGKKKILPTNAPNTKSTHTIIQAKKNYLIKEC